jgi:hypothetical protein
MSMTSNPAKKYEYLKKIPENLYPKTIGPKSNRIAVLGSFDTWSYMHKICTDLVQLGCVAITSRYIYKNNTNPKYDYFRVERDHTDSIEFLKDISNNEEKKYIDMNTFLKEKVIDICDRAIIIYSLPAAHYNEADWCKDKAIESNFKTLGIAFVRKINDDNYCKDCLVDYNLDVSYCKGESTAWDCINKSDCPFKNQGIAKNQLEYFLKYKDNMTIVAIEKIDKTKPVIKKFLNNELILPERKDYIFQCRYDITSNDINRIKEIIKKHIPHEEKIENAYEYIDYYYKPIGNDTNEWIKNNRTLRIREYTNPLIQKQNVDVFSCEVNQKKEGFITSDPFGHLKWFSGPKERATKLLEDHNMEIFLKVIKSGQMYFYFDKLPSRIYIESIQAELPDDKKIEYGHSIEINLWTNKPDNNKEIKEQKDYLVNKFKLNDNNLQKDPVQYFIYNFMMEKNKQK